MRRLIRADGTNRDIDAQTEDGWEQRDAEGPRGTYGCACLDRDAVQCAAIRYGMDHWGEACQCLCHQWSDEDDNMG